MEIRGRTFLAATVACAILLLYTAVAFPSSEAEAGHKLRVARERLAELKKSPKKRRYHSYWIDCVRTFDLVEKEYPSTSAAADACFERAGVYDDLYHFSRHSRDLSHALKAYQACRDAHPRHEKAPEALYRIVVLTKEGRKSRSAALAAYRAMEDAYPDSGWTEKARKRLGLRPPSKHHDRQAELRKPPETVIKTQKGPLVSGVVTNVRYWSGGAYTRVVIDQDAPMKFQVHELKKPDRLVFDILHARIGDAVEKDPLPVHDGILKQVRSAQHDPETVRVVLDLASLQSYAVFPLHEPERLVIDVTGTDESQDDSPAAEAPATALHSGGTTSAAVPVSAAPGSGKLSLSRQMGMKVRTIAIDAGHGGNDPGAIGHGGLKEKDITLDIARRLAKLVKERLDCNVVMTRDSDVFVPLDDRPAIAKTKGADLFVSIHVNANRKRRTRGIETYFQSLRASDRHAMATAALENATSTKTLSQLDTELARILKGLSNQNKDLESVELANYIQNSLVETMRPVKGRIVNLGVKRAFFYVLINTAMPSILAEVGFISNPQEEHLLRQESYRQKIAEALCRGVKKFIESREPKMAGL